MLVNVLILSLLGQNMQIAAFLSYICLSVTELKQKRMSSNINNTFFKEI